MNEIDPATGEISAGVEGRGVHRAMHAVLAELAKSGIGKTRKNEQQGYAFRGIDEAYAAVAPLFAKHGLLMLPHVSKREVTERLSGNNKALFYVTVEAEYEFIAVSDGSRERVGPFHGEAMDSADKATNKAMSAAHKYAIFETFVIPILGMPDADETTHDIVANLTADQTGALTDLKKAATAGIKALEAAWQAAGRDNRLALAPLLDDLKKAAGEAERK